MPAQDLLNLPGVTGFNSQDKVRMFIQPFFKVCYLTEGLFNLLIKKSAEEFVNTYK